MSGHRVGAVIVCVLGAAAGCTSSEPPSGPAVAVAAGTPKPDLMYGGKRYTWTKKATFVSPPGEVSVERAQGNGADASQLTASQLATAMRPKVLKDGDEYVLAEPDVATAQSILDGVAVPATDGYNPGAVPVAGGTVSAVESATTPLLGGKDLAAHPEYIIGNDDRTRVACARMYWPASTKGQYSTGCSGTLIGPHTVAIAAHCVYKNGWFPYGQFSPGADTTDEISCPAEFPFGQFTPTFIAVPGNWNSNEWGYDYAFMDFGPSTPGNTVGWVGTNPNFSGIVTATLQQYPGDKTFPQYWQQTGNVTMPSPTGDMTRIVHYFDIIPGASGAGFVDTTHLQLFGIQSTQNYSCFFWSCSYWNEASNWTSTVYNFFHQFNWP